MRTVPKKNQKTAVTFMRTQLIAGVACCQRIKDGHNLILEREQQNLANARTAVYDAEHSMWQLKMEHRDFDQMAALLELLKFELDSLRQSIIALAAL